jgi:hypothetical protein
LLVFWHKVSIAVSIAGYVYASGVKVL